MLTRLKVSGFKNLVDVDVRFGPFTCIAGANGIGKSNLFDAIHFLSALAGRPLVEAAQSVRGEGSRSTDTDSLFHRVGADSDDRMSFEAEMIVPPEAFDDLGQRARASSTFLRYNLTIVKRRNRAYQHLGPLEVLEEELVHIKVGEAHEHLPFPQKVAAWRKTAVKSKRWAPYFISTDKTNGVIKLHQDGGGHGSPRSLSAVTLPRTVLSGTNAAENPTAVVARREMQSWRLLQLEPSTLRESDDYQATNILGSNGAHLAATLYYLAESGRKQQDSAVPNMNREQVYGQIAIRVSELINDVREVWVDADEKRELLTLMVKGLDGTPHPARALSDGTLRFLALAVLELDPRAQGLLCLEEPENGIHPNRIPAMIRLLKDIPVDTYEEISIENPLRQVIVNTHSPAVVAQVPDDSLLMAELQETFRGNKRSRGVTFKCLSGTWREREGERSVSRSQLLAYLNPVRRKAEGDLHRVVDREDLQVLLPF